MHKYVTKVAFNLRPPRGPWGGAGFFVRQMEQRLEEHGIRVIYDLRKQVDLIVLMDPRDDLENRAFSMEDIRTCRARNPDVRVLHRVNECDARKGTTFMDDLLAKANETADYTVFISEWLRDYHAARWFDVSRPHTCIYNGADPRIFNMSGRSFYDGSHPFRLVTHHWSDNPLKGFDWYARIDEMIAAGILSDVELWVIGRWPANIEWRAARLFPPCRDEELAGLLRQCDAYVTASRWEPCGMHHVEGAQCGLPLLYHEDGGGIVEAGRRYGVGFRDDLPGALRSLRSEFNVHLQSLLRYQPSGDRMCLDYMKTIQALLCRQSMPREG